MRARHLLLTLFVLSACDDDDDGDCCDPAPVFAEVEPNDTPGQANDFGFLEPGDYFFIDGFIRDDDVGGFVDPFDAFAFTASVPLHVDFQLFISNPQADLDVCLYDPQAMSTLQCYATDLNPEQGGVDVTAGGFSFHLVVESFVQDSGYSLEIDVQPLFAALDAAGDGPIVRPTGVRESLRRPRGERDYPPRPAPSAALEIDEHLWIDARTGLGVTIVRVR